jgi:hypothetical protein
MERGALSRGATFCARDYVAWGVEHGGRPLRGEEEKVKDKDPKDI